VSDQLERELIALEPTAKTAVAHMGVDTTTFVPPSSGPANEATIRTRAAFAGWPQPAQGAFPTMLAVGHLLENKNHAALIEAVATMGSGSLAIIGDGPQKERLVALARERGISERVCLAGTVAPDELVHWWHAAQVGLFPSRAEGFGLAALEAVAAGVPVVVGDGLPVAQVLERESAGLSVNVDSPADIATAIAHLAETPLPADRLHAVAQRHSVLAQAERTATLIEGVL
jgi:glycosyltransferase involved in cell wall biosynthesis